jgi:WhiB family redox-sensing transcriptional regulator
MTMAEPSRRREDLPESLTDLIFEAAHAWRVLAACRGLDPELFFIERGESTTTAKAICRGCAVREECLEVAVVRPEKFGIWGGMSERERRKIRVARKRAAS